MKTKHTVLVVEDEQAIMLGLEENLKYAGYDVLTAATGSEALKTALEARPDLILLDIMLPEMSGYEVCRKIRDQGGQMPIVMVTARGDEFDKVHGFEMGADDYVTKPFSINELLARVKAVLSRGARKTGAAQKYEFGDCVLDVGERVLRKRAEGGNLKPESGKEGESEQKIAKGAKGGEGEGVTAKYAKNAKRHPPSLRSGAAGEKAQKEEVWEEVGERVLRKRAEGGNLKPESGKGEGIKQFSGRLKSGRLAAKAVGTAEHRTSNIEHSTSNVEREVEWEEVGLTRTEFDLLAYFCANEGKALSRDTLMNDVWGTEYYGTQRSLDSFVASLRSKIEEKGKAPKHILTVHGVGYKFVGGEND